MVKASASSPSSSFVAFLAKLGGSVDVPRSGRVTVSRDGCSAKLDVDLDERTVRWVSLMSPGGRGWVKLAHQAVREHLAGWTVLASPATDDARDILVAHGDWRPIGKSKTWLVWKP